MIDNVLQISREQIEKAIAILNPCMNDYIYVYDLIDDYYVISEHAGGKVYSSRRQILRCSGKA